MRKKHRKRNWRALVKKWRESGLGKAEFCRQNNIELRRFSYHSIKLGAFSRPELRGQKDSGKIKGEKFAKVVCTESVSEKTSGLTIRFDFGASIEISEGFNAELLKKVLKSVNELC